MGIPVVLGSEERFPEWQVSGLYMLCFVPHKISYYNLLACPLQL